MAQTTPAVLSKDLLSSLAEALENLRFGTITLVVQDGRVIQLERNEKIRLRTPSCIDGGGI